MILDFAITTQTPGHFPSVTFGKYRTPVLLSLELIGGAHPPVHSEFEPWPFHKASVHFTTMMSSPCGKFRITGSSRFSCPPQLQAAMRDTVKERHGTSTVNSSLRLDYCRIWPDPVIWIRPEDLDSIVATPMLTL